MIQKNIVDTERLKAAVHELLLAVGENPARDGLLETPRRIADMYTEIFGGLAVDPKEYLKVGFEVAHSEMVILREIPFYSMCEHHFLPFHGEAHIGYIPDGRVVGISKLARVVEAYARRPQLQEQLTSQVAEAIMEGLQPDGVAVVIEAEHLCMTMRGVKKPGSRMVTSAMRGQFKDSSVTRSEFLSRLGAALGGSRTKPHMLDEPVAATLLITSEELENFGGEWANLHQRVPSATPFTHPAWHEVWLRHFGEGCSPVFLSFRLGEELVGAAALDPSGEIARQLGDHNVCDYAGILALPGHEGAVARGLLEWLTEDMTPVLELWGVPADSPFRPGFQDAAASFNWSYGEAPEAVCPGVDLVGDFESFVASLPRHDRHELRRKLRNLEAAGTLTYEVATSGIEIVPQIDGLLKMMRGSRDAKAAFLSPPMEAFFRDLGATFGALGMARLATLQLDGMAVARTFSFENATTEFLYNCGFDPDYAHLAVGLASKAYAIEAAIRRGKTRFDFLRGDEEYKRRLGGVPLQVYTLTLRQSSGLP